MAELPFMATENIMMDASSAAATGRSCTRQSVCTPWRPGKVVKEQGGENDLLARIANDPLFGTTLEELKASCIRRILSAAPRSKRRNL